MRLKEIEDKYASSVTIEKSSLTPGWYLAHITIDDQFLCGSGRSHKEAINKLFEKIEWYVK